MQISTNNAEDTVKNSEYQNPKKKAQKMIIKCLKVWKKMIDIECKQKTSNIHITGIPILNFDMEMA